MQKNRRADEIANVSLAVRECFCGPDGALSPSGAMVLRELEKRWFTHRSTAQVSGDAKRGFGSIDPLQMAINEGKRVALSELKQLITQSLGNVRDIQSRKAFHE